MEAGGTFMQGKNKKYTLLIAGIFILLFTAGSVAEFYVDYEWFSLYGGAVIFLRLFFTKFYVHAAFMLLFIALFFLNFLLIRIMGGKGRIFTANILDRLRL